MGNELKALTDEEMERMATVLFASGFMERMAKKIATDEGTNNEADNDEISERRRQVKQLLETDPKGIPLQTNNNCKTALREDPVLKDAIRFNELNERVDIIKPVPWRRSTAALTDVDVANLITYLEVHYGLKDDRKIERAIKTVSFDNPYHPIKQYWESLVWDGTERVRHALHHFLGADESELNYQALKIFMLGAISRVYDPGHKFDYMICLVGGQGAGKSTFLRFLAIEDRYFTDDLKNLEGDDVFEKLQGHMIVEMAEMLATVRASNAEEIKAFITRQVDVYRIRYDKFVSEHPRKCVFAGTSNKRQFLPPDKSGNRRFIPIECHAAFAEVHILDDEEESRKYIEQMWAEMMVIFRSGDYSLTLSKEMQEELELLQEDFVPEDPMETEIRDFLDATKENYVCVQMLFYKALGHSSLFDKPKQGEARLIANIMDNIPGWKRVSSHDFFDYGKQRGWVREGAPLEVTDPDGFMPVPEQMEIPFT
ncbi:virulence-associated E family protein [Butyrivibrio sp. YAB3001]|uniref:virulence-associated E family protein n=1 Tax=Butyrivibrio sp. YAB3001 TaxID=1520812 RepID=UPI0008F62566|nr:virulence-associated E family protein [Butyrivibrio sp. YAB3001]SFC11632.1 Virulence-associated protein E [Butyrivibrio sp. YAB3001]